MPTLAELRSKAEALQEQGVNGEHGQALKTLTDLTLLLYLH